MLSRSLVLISLALSAGCAQSGPASAPQPPVRPASAEPARPVQHMAGFAEWRQGFRTRALAAGIGAATFDAAFAGVAPNDEVLERDRFQPEFVRPIWEYLDNAISDTRIANGRRLAAEKAADLARIEAQFGVEREVVVSIWGLESNFGGNYGRIPVIESLATLAFEGRRQAFAEEQLIAALRILEAGDITAARMVGSWAGAMGHTQFIPTSFQGFAVDFTGDGRRDLWAPDALDALASTANYLARNGWQRGQPWGVEVRLPQGFDHALADERPRTAQMWNDLGVRRMTGALVEDHGAAALILPAGARGPAFVVYPNFRVIKRYNNATSYALAVGHLADRIAGGGPILAEWPRGQRPLSRTEKEEMQRMLTALGFDTQGTDGVVGPNTRAAIRAFQSAQGMPADGNDDAALLEALRRASRG